MKHGNIITWRLAKDGSARRGAFLISGRIGTTATLLALNTAMRKDEIRLLRWEQVDFEKRTLRVGRSKTEAGTGRLIPLNAAAFEALALWAGRFTNAGAEHYVFPWCESRQIDPTRPTKGWRTAWRHALKRAGFQCRFHDLRVTWYHQACRVADERYDNHVDRRSCLASAL
jgi:integrase